MKKVLLLGDSIRQGYDKYVKAALLKEAEVLFPNENCRSSSYMVRGIYFWKEQLGLDESIDLIHWNVGLWDTLRMIDKKELISAEQYKENIERILFHFDKWFPNAKIIFATSTPVREEMFGECKRFNADIERYNEIACDVIKSHGGCINDLYSVMKECPLSYHSDMTHFFTEKGTEVITNAVLEAISRQLEIETPKLDFSKCYNRINEFLGI